MQGLAVSKKRTGLRKLVVFVIGGITRSEMRWMHKKGLEMQRDIIIGSTAIVTPETFVEQLAGITGTLLKGFGKGGGEGPSARK